MIPHGHEHFFRPISKNVRDNGDVEIHQQCSDNECGMVEQRIFRSGVPIRLAYRYGGIWFSPVDLLRMPALPVTLCPECEGQPFIEPCETCAGIGAVENAGRLAIPDLKVARP